MRTVIEYSAKYFSLILLIVITPRIAFAVDIPDANSWTENGIVLTGGSNGSWDVNISGAISPSAIVKKDGTYYLYYVGADGIRSTDGGPRHRAMGVATSTDGINFTKYSGNPILTYLPNNNEEEGLFSAGAMLDDNGEILLYYSACEAADSRSEQVSCHGFLATSTDGLNFSDQGIVLNYKDSSVWGSGDELFPVGAFKDNGTYYLYYIAKGSGVSWGLGVASGTSKTNLSTTKAVTPAGDRVAGGINLTRLSANQIALFLVRWDSRSNWYTEARTVSTADPSSMTAAKVRYNFSNTLHTMFYFDTDKNKWFMYYLNNSQTEVRVKTTSATGSLSDTIAPGKPLDLK